MAGEQTLAAMVRAKYPGAYDDMDDAALEAAVDAKYPGAYKDIPRSQKKATPLPAAATAGMMANSTAEGGDPGNPRQTVFGRGMRDDMEAALMGADVMAEPVGPPTLKAIGVLAKGTKAVPGVIVEGAKRATGLSKVRGGQNMQAALTAAAERGTSVNPNAARAIGNEMLELGEMQNVPRVARAFMKRTAPLMEGSAPTGIDPMKAQRYVTSMGRGAAAEEARLSPEMRRMLTQMQIALRGDLAQTAGRQYTKGVNEFRRASRAGEAMEKTVGPGLKKTLMELLRIAGYGTAAGAGSRLLSND